MAQPLLAQQHFTDAPPGVEGGAPLPFVGGAAVMGVRVQDANRTVLGAEDLKELQRHGWGILNHSYFHAGRTWGDPPEILTPEQVRNDLFWSQTIFAALSDDGRAPTHFVYPNGYTGYRDYLHEFGLFSGSRVGGSGGRMPYAEKADPLDLPRNYLDERKWAESGKGDPMHGFPDEPATGQFVIDFTHGISDDPASENHRRWVQRLSTIGERFGERGRDNVWCAPTGDVVAYVRARRGATIDAAKDSVTVTVPDGLPGTRLTLRLTGFPAGVVLAAPDGGLLYRRGDDAWVTTPVLGTPGSPPPSPAVRRAYVGEVRDVVFEQPVRIAAVRLLQAGKVEPGFTLKLEAAGDGGFATPLISAEQAALADGWGVWRLYSTVPNKPAISAKMLRVSPDKSLKQMEVWVLE